MAESSLIKIQPLTEMSYQVWRQEMRVGFSKGLGSNVYLFKVQYGEYGEHLKTDEAQKFVRPAEYTLE